MILTAHPTHGFGNTHRYSYDRQFPPVATVAATLTLTKQDSGKAITNRGSALDLAVTLPAPEYGLTFRFVKAVVDKDIVVNTNVAGVKLHGGSGATQGVTLTNNTDTQYGTVTLWCDGTAWFVVGQLGTWAVS